MEKDLQEKPLEELQKELLTAKDRLWQLKNDLFSGKVKNISEVHKLKKKIAAINTLINKHV